MPKIFTLKRLLTGLCLITLHSALAWAQSTAEIAQQIAPTGVLRAVINLGNPILARKEASSPEAEGISVDLAHELAEALRLPLRLMPVISAAQSVQAVTHGQADIGFFAIDSVRGQGIAFTPPYILIEGSYLVRKDAPLTDNTQVDQAGQRVVVGQGSAYDLFLTRELKNAELVRAPTSPQVVPFFLSGPYDVAAGVKQQLESDMQKYDHLRLLPGRFMVIEQAMGQPSGASPAARKFLADFVARMKSERFVQQSLLRHRIEGASIAP